MKYPLSLLLGIILCATLVRAQGPKIEVTMAKARDGKAMDTFSADVPKIYALFESKGTKKGDQLRGVWIAEDVGDVAPKGSQIDEATVTPEKDDASGTFSLSKPTNGWPPGKYRVEIYDGSKLAVSAKFTIEGAAKTETAEDDAASESSAADDGQYSFKVHNTTKEKIVKLLASEDGKEYGDFDIGAGIGAGKTITLNWDKKTNGSGCEWYFKAEFADGTETPEVKFDFCEEDLELEF
jgi:hypothetical protein